MKKNFLILLSAMVWLTGCQSPGTQEQGEAKDSLQVTHKLGNTPVLKNPSRIVVLDIGALETLYELGVVPTGIPKKYLPSYLDVLKNNEQIADVGSVIEPDFEAISALSPELILISTRQERFYPELSDIAPTVFIGTDNKDYIPSFIQNTVLLGQIVGKEEEVKQKLEGLQKSIKSAQEKFAQDPRKGLFLIYNNGRFSAFGKGSRFGFVHDVLHIKPVMDLQDESVHGQKVSNELIAESNPDFLFIVDRNAAVVGKKANTSEMENPLIRQTAAYKNKQIYYLDPNVWFISGGGLTSVQLMVNDIVNMIK